MVESVNMKYLSKQVRIGSVWAFRHSSSKVLVKIFSINKIYIEEKIGKKLKKMSHTEIEYGLRNAASGHICQNLEGFLSSYEWRENG